MQNQSKSAKNKTPLVFKPYLKGNLFDGAAMKRGLRLMAYYLMFAFLYLIVGSALQFGGFAVRPAVLLADLRHALGVADDRTGLMVGVPFIRYGRVQQQG